MLIGNPDKFALLLEIVPEWRNSNFINGLLYVYVNGQQFPKELRTTTLSDDVFYLLDNSPFVQPCVNNELYHLEPDELFYRLCQITFPEDTDNDYSYLIPLEELSDAKYIFFIVATNDRYKIIVGDWKNPDKKNYIDYVEVDIAYHIALWQRLREFYDNEIKND